jgi:hypothetical protein
LFFDWLGEFHGNRRSSEPGLHEASPSTTRRSRALLANSNLTPKISEDGPCGRDLQGMRLVGDLQPREQAALIDEIWDTHGRSPPAGSTCGAADDGAPVDSGYSFARRQSLVVVLQLSGRTVQYPEVFARDAGR